MSRMGSGGVALGVRAAAFVAALVSAGGARAAEPTASDRDTSRSLYAQGMEALDRRDYPSAERACGGAYALVKVPTAATCWGRALVGLGKLIEGRDVFVEATHIPAKADEAAVLASARETAGTEADALEKRIPTVTLTVSGPSEATPLHVILDGASVKPETARLPRKLNPGHHTLTVSAHGFGPATADVTIAEGEERQVQVTLPPMAPAEARKRPEQAQAQALRATPAPPQGAHEGVPTLAIVVGGVGVAGLVVGSIFGVMALSDASGLKSQPGCPSSCPPSAQSQIGALHGAQWGSDIGLGVGVVGLAVGAVMFFTSHAPEAPSATSLRLDVGPGAVGLRGRF